MFCADSLENPAVLVAVKGIRWISVNDIYAACCYLVPELFDPNRRNLRRVRAIAGVCGILTSHSSADKLLVMKHGFHSR